MGHARAGVAGCVTAAAPQRAGSADRLCVDLPFEPAGVSSTADAVRLVTPDNNAVSGSAHYAALRSLH